MTTNNELTIREIREGAQSAAREAVEEIWEESRDIFQEIAEDMDWDIPDIFREAALSYFRQELERIGDILKLL